jgi:V8-like Glu-specific endopeptidase
MSWRLCTPTRRGSGEVRRPCVRRQPLIWPLAGVCAVLLWASAAPASPHRPSAQKGSDLDRSAEADLQELRALVRAQLAPFAEEAIDPDDVVISFVGRAEVTRVESDDEWIVDPGGSGPPSDAVVVCIRWRKTREVHPDLAHKLVARHVATVGPCDHSWRAFNPATRNEFKLDVPAGILEAVHVRQEQNGLTRPSKGRVGDSKGDAPEDGSSPPVSKLDELLDATRVEELVAFLGGLLLDDEAHASLADGDDDRVLLTPTTLWPWRTICDMGGCTGTLVGPRHVATAGHCLYSRTQGAWYLNITVTPGMDRGAAPFGSSSLPPGPGESGWYFTPSLYRAANPAGGASQYDFGIIVVPDRLGDETGWMGYVTRPASDLDAARNYNRGYPWCESETTGTSTNPERIDEPDNVTQANDGTTPGGGSCSINGLYGDTHDCDLGDWSKSDGSWYRRVRHSCDASAAMSGSPLYQYFPSSPNAVLFAVHTTSLKCRLASDNACSASDDRPLEATRLTVEYRDWISYFRSMFP